LKKGVQVKRGDKLRNPRVARQAVSSFIEVFITE